VANYSKEKKRKERKENSKALACLMSIVLSFVFALCY
jgi:hypothetical protein